ncbi:MAG: J domain-containing protein [Bacteroidetes bacterium]|nr:J domain-containing protein [Bacteroidota bacterium]
MALKDYYSTLEVRPTATEQEIKKSFRRLVLRFHPDKNNGDAVAEARFREIREAYEVLIDPAQREEYNYKRWYNRSLGKQFQAAPLTPQGILNECKQLWSYVEMMTTTRVDYDALSYHIRNHLLNEANLRLLRQYADAAANKAIIVCIERCCRSLPWKYIPPVATLLREVAGDDAALQAEADAFLVSHRSSRQWNRYRVVLVLLATVLLCVLIYMVSRE